MRICHLGLQNYQETWELMQRFTSTRQDHTEDELWLLEHPPVYTQGQAGKAEHLFNPGNIPVIQSDRGGQVTYHGPGQLVAYVLMDLKRRKLGIRTLVCQLEKVLLQVLAVYQIQAHLKDQAPGVYVADQKIASVGLRVRKNCTYHGIALNVDMDLAPFQGIHPCGFKHLKMTQIKEYDAHIRMEKVTQDFIKHFLDMFESHHPE